ncbi:MAG: RNA polymerase sigma factor [Phycisphaerae bacterium]
MSDAAETCWTMIRDAAAGDARQRDVLARTYGPAIGAYLHARWTDPRRAADVDDATQEVFVELFRANGALQRANAERGGFRALLYGVVRNVALRIESRRAAQPPAMDVHEHAGIVADETRLSLAFDRAWAVATVRAAASRMRRAAGIDVAAVRRVELLQMRFENDLPIREIAARWAVDAGQLHHEYAKARAEFREALRIELTIQHPDDPAALEREWHTLLGLL